MAQPNEDTQCYSSPAQRSILLRFAEHPLVSKHFFLTGGTALSVFYLHHRTSEDLDFFSVEPVQLADLSFWIGTVWQKEQAIVRNSPQFLSLLIQDVKVDFVIDPLSDRGHRPRFPMDRSFVTVDNLSNIAANKLCTVVSRTEPKDFVDLYFLLHRTPGVDFETSFNTARKREALFDDPPTAAYQLERSLEFVRTHPELMPKLRAPLEPETMFSFYEALAEKIYRKMSRE